MAKFLVSINEVARYTVPVEADTEDEARTIAVESIIEDGAGKYFTGVEDRNVYMVLRQD